MGAPDKYKRKAKWRAYIAEFPIIPLQKKYGFHEELTEKSTKSKKSYFKGLPGHKEELSTTYALQISSGDKAKQSDIM